MSTNLIKKSNIINFEYRKNKKEMKREMIRKRFVEQTLENFNKCNFTNSEAMLVTTSLLSEIMEIDFRKE